MEHKDKIILTTNLSIPCALYPIDLKPSLRNHCGLSITITPSLSINLRIILVALYFLLYEYLSSIYFFYMNICLLYIFLYINVFLILAAVCFTYTEDIFE